MFGVNSAGIKCKLESLDVILNQLNPQIWTIQETKLKPNEKLKSEVTNKYQIYYLYRKESQGGGLAIGIDKEIESTLIKEGNDEVEAIVVQIMLDRFPIKVVARRKKRNSGVFWRKRLLQQNCKTMDFYCKWMVICMVDLTW